MESPDEEISLRGPTKSQKKDTPNDDNDSSAKENQSIAANKKADEQLK